MCSQSTAGKVGQVDGVRAVEEAGDAEIVEQVLARVATENDRVK